MLTKSQISENMSHDGVQGVYKHVAKTTQCEMTFAVFMPPNKKNPSPVLWYLSGLTCNHSNVMEKGGYRRLAAELGIAIVCPDTSPRGESVPDEKDNWQFGAGAGFYIDATEFPFSVHYNMSSYILDSGIFKRCKKSKSLYDHLRANLNRAKKC